MQELKKCPFCGGDAELDPRQGYRALGTGRMGNRVVAYCRDCGADMGVCIEDVPDITPEQVAEMWNRRAAVEADRAIRTVPSDESITGLWQECTAAWNAPGGTGKPLVQVFARALLERYSQPAASAEPDQLKTDDQIGFVLTAIRHYGSQRFLEGKGLADAELSNVRAAWDAVYNKVQDLAYRPVTQAQDRETFEAWCDRNEYDRAQRLDGTGYNNPSTARAWQAWKDCAALAQQPGGKPTMPPLNEAMRAVLRNERDIYGDEDTLYAALCEAARAAIEAHQRQHTTESLLLGRILATWHNTGETGDIDGAWLQDAVIAAGLAVQGNEGYALTPRAMELISMACLPTSTVDNPLENPMTDLRQPSAARACGSKIKERS